ncbi:MAG: ornithine cyclodeaminase family protein [Dehalococcoidia bacterium]|jgi:alanine dehydrogenase|nr:ornithine cyclodeaminase family protein [Dehalococcoidia bacterium]
MAERLRILRASDLDGTLDMRDVLALIERAFAERGLGRTEMPPKSYLHFPSHQGVLLIMPGNLPQLEQAAVKLINVHTRNPVEHGLPTLIATVVLISPETGEPLCIMDGTYVTGMRTGAVSGVATKYLARKDARVLGIVGAGFQGPFQLDAVRHSMAVDEVLVADLVLERARKLAERARGFGLKARACETVEEVVRGCDVLVTATPSDHPIVKDDWVHEGMHINCVGTYAKGKQEIEGAILTRAMVVVDDWEQASHAGEINVPVTRGEFDRSGVYAELPQIVAGLKPGRTDDSAITVFDTTGLAIQDVVTAWQAFQVAKERNLGFIIDPLYT